MITITILTYIVAISFLFFLFFFFFLFGLFIHLFFHFPLFYYESDANTTDETQAKMD